MRVKTLVVDETEKGKNHPTDGRVYEDGQLRFVLTSEGSMRFRYTLFSIILFTYCSNEPEATTDTKGDLHILFVGNSLTYTNDLPVLIKELGLRDGMTITYSSLLFPN